MEWNPDMSAAPRDGTVVLAGKPVMGLSFPLYEIPSKFVDGRWCWYLRGEWSPYDPQPTMWKLPPPSQEPTP